MAAAREGFKRKRRPKNVCPNPLFVKWLEEWRDEAMENGWKTSYTFNKALYSMKKYPLPINSGQEAKVLEYVGDKVAKMLDKKIAEYLADGGSEEDFHRIPSDEAPPPPAKRSNKATPVERPCPITDTQSPSIGTHSRATNRTQSQSSETHSQNSQSDETVKKKRRRSTKEYVPNYRSGPYAIMLALYKAEKRDNYKGFMFKNELIEAAQPYCDSSFTVPEVPDSHYTAWSSMTNIIKKGLVTKSSHPPRFSLTDAGITLSIRLCEQTESAVISSSQERGTSSNTDEFGDKHMTCSQEESLPNKEQTPITIIDSDSDDGIEIVLPLAQRLALKTISSNTCTDLSRPIDKMSRTQSNSVSRTQSNSVSRTQCVDVSDTHSTRTHSNVLQTQALTTSVTTNPSTNTSYNGTSYSNTSSISSLSKNYTSTSSSIPSSSTLCSSSGEKTSDEITSEIVPPDLSSPLYCLKPGEFEVVLCIDNTESTANRKSKSHFRGLLLEELAKNGVKFSVRNLNVGDFLWIAKEISTSAPGQLRLPQSREIVLEHIVERKRMDDLADSIIDRRFHEQKFRLNLCGVANPIYLVEEYGDMAHCKISQKGLYQAIANTHILDGFHIKQTKDIKDSIGYLTILTRLLKQKYEDKIINAYPVDTLQSLNKQRDTCTVPFNSVCGVPFDKFNEYSIKNKVSTVSEMFARQLIQIPGSSADKAHSIIQLYPTMSNLYDGYIKCFNEKERENLLLNVRFGTNQRKIGAVLSKTIYSLYWKGQ